jgi:hypothetical protein
MMWRFPTALEICALAVAAVLVGAAARIWLSTLLEPIP